MTADNDGIVDNTDIPEADLKMCTLVNSVWEVPGSITVNPDENYVEAKTSHFSIFGLGNIVTPIPEDTSNDEIIIGDPSSDGATGQVGAVVLLAQLVISL